MSSASPTAERVYFRTKEAILSGAIPGGTLLSEAEIARQLAVSRTPAREAFVRLAAEGLLSLLPRRGAIVTPLSPTEAIDLLEVRHSLESAAIRRLATIAATERRARLEAAEQALTAQSARLAQADLTGFIAADERFHFALVEASGNRVAVGIYGTLGDRQRRLIAATLRLSDDRVAQLVPEHRRLLERAAIGDADGFSAELRVHLENTYATLAPTL